MAGRHVVVTGAASGIGKATVLLLASQGVAVHALDVAACPQWFEDSVAAGRGSWVRCDVADEESVIRAWSELEGVPIDGLVTCAGVSARGGLESADSSVWRRVLDVNVVGTALCARSFAAQCAGRPGAIVTVSSTGAFGCIPGLSPVYHASKGAVLSLTRALAGELGPRGIRVNSVAPGAVRTPMTEAIRKTMGEDLLASRSMLGRIVEAEEIAATIAFLLSPEASMLNGVVVPVEGGQVSRAAYDA